LFGEQVDKNDEDANDNEEAWDVKAMVRKRIERLRRGHTTVDGWKLTLDDLDTRDICSAHDIFNIQMKCKYLSVALRIALDEMPLLTWRQCCDEAVARVNTWETHKHIKNGETIRIWHHDFRASSECFRNPNVYKRNGKPPLPPMLERNPDFTRSIIGYAKTKLNELSAELLFNYLHTIALPALLLQRQEELADNNFEMTDLLRENRLDFINEETLLQYHGKMLGVLVDRSPKCHPEVAGEGIEYSWGCGKGKYRRLPLTDKRRKENFRNSVRQCLDRMTVLTIERQRMFSKRARQYMLAYHSIELSKEKRESGGEAESSNAKLEMSAYLVEKIIKTYKSHRGATDFDSAYIGAIVNDMKSGVGCSVT